MGTSASLAVNGRSSRRFTWPWLRPIVEWFFCYPPLVLETAGLLLIVLAIEWDPLGATQIGLPGLFWLNFFGRRYRDFVGADRLGSAPAPRVVTRRPSALNSTPLTADPLTPSGTSTGTSFRSGCA